MDIKEINRIANTLSPKGEEEQGYYVYALYEKKGDEVEPKPFYIGKGKNGRLFSHVQEVIQKLKKNLKVNLDELVEKEIKLQEDKDNESAKKEVMAKYEKIKEILKAGNKVEHVIIKWGLTENEAFMAESALINICRFNDETCLTNKVNGHRSSKEKENISRETKARSSEDFLENCAIEIVNVKKIRVPIFMVDIAKTYYEKRKIEKNNNDDIIYDCVRAAWILEERKIKYIEYVFALVNCKVVGIYKVDKNHWIRRKDAKSKGYVQPQYQYDIDNRYLALYNEYGNDVEKIKSACKKFNYNTKECLKWGERFCFERIDTKIDSSILSFKNKLLCFPNGYHQNEHYNFDEKKGKVVLKEYK